MVREEGRGTVGQVLEVQEGLEGLEGQAGKKGRGFKRPPEEMARGKGQRFVGSEV